MAACEDLVSWLKDKLLVERQLVDEQHQQLKRAMFERHMCLITEAESRLRENFRQQLLDVQVPVNEVQETSMETIARQTSPKVGACSSIQTTVSHRPYKSEKLKNLSGQGIPEIHDRWLAWIVNQPVFEAISGAAIIVNTVLLACETEYQGFTSGSVVGFKNYRPSEEVLPGADAWFGYFDITFVCFFTIEACMRIGAAGRQSVCSGWIWFDTVIVALSWTAMLLGDEVDEAVDPTVMRVARLARMLRAFKLIQTIRAFDSLYLLIKSIQASVGALFWSFVLLIFVQVAVGLCFCQILRQYIQNEAYDVVDRERVFLYWGTFSRTMVTMFEITLSNWTPSCRILMNQVSEWFGFIYVCYNCCFIFAVIRVIQAVFIAETNRVVAADDQIAVRRKQQDTAMYLNKLTIMFEELDQSGDGLLQRDELQQVVDDKLLKALMSTLGINVHDLDDLFNVLDNGEGEIDIQDFISGLTRVKGTAQSIDLVPLLKASHVLDTKCDMILEKIGFQASEKRKSRRSTFRTSSKNDGTGSEQSTYSFHCAGRAHGSDARLACALKPVSPACNDLADDPPRNVVKL